MDPRFGPASQSLLKNGNAFLNAQPAVVMVYGGRKEVVEVHAMAERQHIIDAVRQAGFVVLEDAVRIF